MNLFYTSITDADKTMANIQKVNICNVAFKCNEGGEILKNNTH
jgi:hypothetical protein